MLIHKRQISYNMKKKIGFRIQLLNFFLPAFSCCGYSWFVLEESETSVLVMIACTMLCRLIEFCLCCFHNWKIALQNFCSNGKQFQVRSAKCQVTEAVLQETTCFVWSLWLNHPLQQCLCVTLTPHSQKVAVLYFVNRFLHFNSWSVVVFICKMCLEKH